MKREEGFYWVKWVGDWIVAQWVCTEDVGCWRTTFSNELLEDVDFDEIAEERLFVSYIKIGLNEK